MADVSLAVRNDDSALPEGQTPERIARELAALIEGEVRFSFHDRMLYATDASIYQVVPIGVVVPRHVEDVEAVVKYCQREKLPILPRGGGTALAGQTVNTAIVIDFSAHCRSILEIDPEKKFAWVQPGLVLDHFNAELAKYGLMFGPDVATSTHANLGGMIGNNSAGVHSILYGRTVENVLALESMLVDGTRMLFEHGASETNPRIADLTRRIADVILPLEKEIDDRFPKILRRGNGYNLDMILSQIRASAPETFDRVNLAQLLCGSEGTLALTMRAKLKLVEMPKHKALIIIAFSSVDAAMEAVGEILKTGPAAVELIDDTVIRSARDNPEYRRYVELLPNVSGGDSQGTGGSGEPGSPGAVLYVEYFLDDEDEFARHLDVLKSMFGAGSMETHTDPGAMGSAWKLRKAGEPLLNALPGLRKPLTFIEDLAVDPARLPEFVRDFRRIVERHHTTAAYYAHASVGCLHIRPLINLHDPEDVTIMNSIAREATDLVMKYDGSLSGEDGDGRLRSHLLQQFYGKNICDAFRKIKDIFDPDNRLNPGNIVEPKPMDVLLRVKPDERSVVVPQVETYFRYEREAGFASALEMCNGSGMCRKTVGGTMCPSYRATRDERHSTRGRGNALRLAITGQLSGQRGIPDWNDLETLRTLDLCLSCKACKSECPSNVDVARLKAEYLAQGFKRTGKIPLSTRMFGRVRRANELGSKFHILANALGRFPPSRALANRLLGLDPRRSLPRFASSLRIWFLNRAKADLPDDAPVVILFPDCFTLHNEPHIGRATISTLEGLGYRVILPETGCCGRSLISVGMLAEASDVCTQTANALIQSVRDHDVDVVVGCEPSCISAIKDDWLDLRMNVDDVELRVLADKTMLVEEFIERSWDSHPRKPEFKIPEGNNQPVLLHGHCHQKALWGMDDPESLLARLAGDRFQLLDSGCCGMAGSFGFTRDHYDLSLTIAEESLFRLIRQEPDSIVLASGTSCRHQLHDGMKCDALHPIEFIARALGLNG